MGNVTRAKGELRNLAALAKERMKSGYWEKARAMRETAKSEARAQGKNVESVDSYFRAKFNHELMIKAAPSDDTLYRRVCDILDSNEDISNPIALLIEKDKYNALDNQGKQRYIMMLSAKYRELSERYYKEKHSM